MVLLSFTREIFLSTNGTPMSIIPMTAGMEGRSLGLQGAPKPIERPCAPGMAFCHGKPEAITPLSVIEVMHLP